MSNNIVDGILASVLFALLSTGVGFIFQALGFSSQEAFLAGVSTLFILLMIFLAGRNVYPNYKRRLTVRLVEEALNSKVIGDVAVKNKIVTRVFQDYSDIVSNHNGSLREFDNQIACEAEICEAFRTARKVKILTIRGEKYFLSSRSLFYDLYLSKQEKGCRIEILVLSPESNHISEELAKNLGHPSAERTRRKMRIALENLKHLSEEHKNFDVRCYTETPNFKMLLFDDVMFVSAFGEEGGPKNDQNARMWLMRRDRNPIFMGLERHFDKLWERSILPE